MRMFLWLVLCLAALTDSAFGADDSIPAPHWIWSSAAKSPDIEFSRQFEVSGVISSATLRFAADFCRASVQLNGQVVLVIEPYSPTVQLDVTAHVARGRNKLVIRADRSCGPSAVAMSLVVNGASGRQAIVTDASFSNAKDLGPLAPELWGTDRRSAALDPFDNYEQWRTALGTAASGDTAAYWIPPGFQLSLLRRAAEGEGSWISMAFDAQGRLTISREDRGLLRMTLSPEHDSVTHVETVNEDLQECRGLLYAYDALYANANNLKGLYRLRDTDGDDRFDEVRLLREFPGRVGHGRNDLTLGPDGFIYSIHGDAVDVPTRDVGDRTSPFREARRGRSTSEGYLVRTDREGRQWEVVCSGLRNPYGIGVHPNGDLFTYDADAEFDMGTPWYRPTRVVQLRSGADFGWRGVTGQWPPYFPDHPDNALPTLDIGRGSPTAVAFGTGSAFPHPYDKALFILDWAYGRMLAVHLAPRGAGYRAQAETFLQGRPMNLTDLAFGPDGALYLITGGRKTQSALYRVAYKGGAAPLREMASHQRACAEHAAKSRALLTRLESFHGRVDSNAVEVAWPHLDDPDPTIRHAARIAVEHQPLDAWRGRALAEQRTTASLTALMALARSGDASLASAILERLRAFRAGELDLDQKLMLLHSYATLLPRTADGRAEIDRQVNGLFAPGPVQITTTGAGNLPRDLLTLRSQLGTIRGDDALAHASLRSDRQENRLQALLVLRHVREGWAHDRRREYFAALNEMPRFVAGEGMPKFLGHLKQESLATLSDTERETLKDVLDAGGDAEDPGPPPPPRPVIKKWTMEDFAEAISASAPRGDASRGAAVFRDAQCVRCHRVGARGPAVGPDLTFVARRFSRRDLLESILSPSQVIAEHYRNVQVQTKDGRTLVGRVLIEGDFRSETLRIATDPLHPSVTVEVNKRDVDEYRLSDTSPMPTGLLDGFQQSEILDLLAYLEK